MTQTTSVKGRRALKNVEGEVLRAYRDVAGIWTIGVGITTAAGLGKITAGMTITKEQSDAMLTKALVKFEKRVSAALGEVPQNVFDAAVMFDYNTGQIHAASWVKLYKARRFAEAETSFKSWNKSTIGGKKRVVKGLVNRRAIESNILFRNQYPDTLAGAIPRRANIADDGVVLAKTFLMKKGLFSGALDSVMTNDMRNALKIYQSWHPDLTSDGVLGIATLSQMQRDAQFIGASVKAIAPGALVALSTFVTPIEAWLTEQMGADLVQDLALSGVVLLVLSFAGLLWRYSDVVAMLLQGDNTL